MRRGDAEANSRGIMRYARAGQVVWFDPFTLDRKYFPAGKEGSTIPTRSNNRTIHMGLSRLDTFRVEVTLSCNCRCEYCIVSHNAIPERGEAMRPEVARRLAHRFCHLPQPGQLLIMGGEPLLNWPATEVLAAAARERGVLFTNGTLLADRVPALSRFGTTVLVSLDGLEEHNHGRRYADGRPSFNDALRGYRVARDAGCRVGILSVARPDSVASLAQVARHLYADLMPDIYGISLPHYTQSGFLHVDASTYADQLADLALEGWARRAVPQIQQRLAPLSTHVFRLISCKVAGEQWTFYPSGRRTLCTKMDGIGHPGARVRGFYRSRLPLFQESCHDCAAVGLCGGGCAWDAVMIGDGVRDPRECIVSRRLVEAFLWIFRDEELGSARGCDCRASHADESAVGSGA